MKKGIRIFAVLVSLLLLCLSLCSCNTIDEMRKEHAVWNDDGSIALGDITYRPLPSCEELTIATHQQRTVYVTDKDVPVLLSAMLGTMFHESIDGRFLVTAYGDKDYGVYCKSDSWEEMSERINAGIALDNYCYTHWNISDDGMEVKKTYVLLSPEQTSALAASIQSRTPITLPAGAQMSYDTGIEIYRCSEDMLFQSYAFILCLADDTCFITVYNVEDGSYDYYAIDDAYQPTLRALMAAYSQA